jgi:hypothetical protein
MCTNCDTFTGVIRRACSVHQHTPFSVMSSLPVPPAFVRHTAGDMTIRAEPLGSVIDVPAVLPCTQHDQNQPPVTVAKSTACVLRPRLSKIKRPVTTKFNRHTVTQKSTVHVLANGIAKFPVWVRHQQPAQLITRDGNCTLSYPQARTPTC